MCGISGIIQFSNKEVSKASLLKMTDTIAHRGPDDSGYYISPNKKVGMGSRRLAIQDLSAKGHQPMRFQNRYVITYNGEVYNFSDEKRKLSKDGFHFVSHSDTEVVLALYAKYGINCLSRLRGMFAFAIYDEWKNTLFLARDRVGKKPLKYFLNSDCFIFASELKALLTQKNIRKSVDFTAIASYLTFGYCPAPLTGFEGINKLEPGSYIYIDLNNYKFVKKRYWEPSFSTKLDMSEEDWCKEIIKNLEESTRIRMISDVPIGAFLSGGVDSSAVVATMAGLSTKPIKTFTISFKDKELNEGPFAANIAKRYKTDHHVLTAKPQSVELLPFLAKQFEEPFADASNVVSYLVSEMSRKYVTVALNGDGADEFFAGYPNRYLRLKRDVDYNRWIQCIRPIAIRLFKSYPKAGNFFEKSKQPLYQRFASYNKIFSPDEIPPKILDKTYSNPYEIIKKCFESFEGKDLKDAGLKFDQLYFLPDQLLTKMDMASMAASLEARSPFLDYKMIELANKIPFDLKVKGGETKYILKKALEKIVPKENLYRPKIGFTIPLKNWFSGKLNHYAEEVLLAKGSFVLNLFDTDYIRKIVYDNNKSEDFGPRIWSLITLELWHKSYFT